MLDTISFFEILKSSQRYESEKLRSIINCIVRSTTFANWLNWKFISKYMPFLTSLATSLWWKLSMTSSITWFTIQVALFVGGENGSLVKHYLKIPFSSLVSFSFKIPKTPLKIETFQKMWRKWYCLLELEKMGSPDIHGQFNADQNFYVWNCSSQVGSILSWLGLAELLCHLIERFLWSWDWFEQNGSNVIIFGPFRYFLPPYH